MPDPMPSAPGPSAGAAPAPGAFDPRTITRPDEALLTHILITSLLSLFLFPLVFLPLWLKYRTLRYRFDDQGIVMSWGWLWRREINLTYRRIQDIHVTRGLIQRWLKLATVSVQTASGSSTPEMQIEGVLEFEALRDFLYTKMRGARHLDGDAPVPAVSAAGAAADSHQPADEALALLAEIREGVTALRRRVEALERRSS